MTYSLNAREAGRTAVKNSIDSSVWLKNQAFSESLVSLIQKHRLMNHPILKILNTGKLNLQGMQRCHLEFRHAFGQIFTDVLLTAMLKSNDLEARMGAAAKVAARMLLQINLSDELGFKPGISSDGGYIGDPLKAHYSLLDDTLNKLGTTKRDIESFVPLPSSVACRETYENNFQDYTLLVCLIALSETVFHDFANPWAQGVAQCSDLDIHEGYHSLHVMDDVGDSIEDGHSQDAWFLFTQAITSDRYDEVSQKVSAWLDIWAGFCDDLSEINSDQQNIGYIASSYNGEKDNQFLNPSLNA